jgi:hypothetical protein
MEVVLNSGYLDILFYPFNLLVDMEKYYTITENITALRHTVFKTIYDILSILIEKHGDNNEV